MRRARNAGGVLLVVLGIAVAVAGCGGAGPNTIVLYNGQHPQLTNALVAAFTRATGIHVETRTGDGIVLADQLLQEGSASPADVYFTENSPELTNLAAHHLLAKLPSAILGQIPARYNSPVGDWAGVALRVSSLVYDPPKVSTAQPPKSILALAQPQWKGRVAIAPADSDFPPLVAAVIAREGQAATVRWLAGLKQNAASYQDDEAVVAAVNRGDAAVGIINQYYWYRLRLQVGASGIHSRLYFFPGGDPGSVENISGAGILASTKHVKDAQAFVRFITSAAGQRILADSYDFEYPAHPGIAANPVLPPIARLPATTISASALGTDQTAAQLIQQAGLT
jgi:iron(III) transport system substrate-binding protein